MNCQYNVCPEFEEKVRVITDEICATHHAHYQHDEHGLVNPKNNSDHVYHLYSDGELTYQKGGFCYLQRTEFKEKCAFFGKDLVTLPKEIKNTQFTYAILTEEEGILLCNKMIRLHNKYTNCPERKVGYIRPIWPKSKIDEMMHKVDEFCMD